jgi:LPS sulfotransferase NodH
MRRDRKTLASLKPYSQACASSKYSPTVTERIIGIMRGSLTWQLLAVLAGNLLGSSRYRNFLILSSARSGSNLLVDYMRGHWRIHCHREILNEDYYVYGSLIGKSEFRRRLQIRSLFTKVPQLPFRAPFQFVGAKILIDQFSQVGMSVSEVCRVLGNPRLIVLYRNDLLETYVSREIARSNGLWYSTKSPNEETIFVEWERFRSYCEEERALWRACLLEIKNYSELHFVDYNSLVNDPVEEVGKVLSFIGVESNRKPVQRSVRQNPWPLSKKVANYTELEMREDVCGAFRFLSLPEEGMFLEGTGERS